MVGFCHVGNLLGNADSADSEDDYVNYDDSDSDEDYFYYVDYDHDYGQFVLQVLCQHLLLILHSGSPLVIVVTIIVIIYYIYSNLVYTYTILIGDNCH